MIYPLALMALGILLVIAFALLVLVAGWGDRAGARRHHELRAATPYTPPANSRPEQFDRYGRPL